MLLAEDQRVNGLKSVWLMEETDESVLFDRDEGFVKNGELIVDLSRVKDDAGRLLE